jgi:hypothetical protein
MRYWAPHSLRFIGRRLSVGGSRLAKHTRVLLLNLLHRNHFRAPADSHAIVLASPWLTLTHGQLHSRRPTGLLVFLPGCRLSRALITVSDPIPYRLRLEITGG